MITLDLPWPPSVNTYYRSPRSGRLAGRTLISEAGRNYRKAVEDYVRLKRLGVTLRGSLAIRIMAFPPDRRTRDLDNCLKALLDSITHAKAVEDDGLFDKITIERGPVMKGGLVRVCIDRYEPPRVAGGLL